MSIPNKQEIRQRMLDLIKSQKEDVALRKTRAILETLIQLPVFVRAGTILFYASFKGEVDTFGMMEKAIELGKRVAVPFVVKETKEIIPVVIASTKDLKPGTYGIPEPCPDNANTLALAEIDLALVPGVAFDRMNNRLGRGAGYYDRFLSRLPSDTPTLGLAYDFQIIDTIPCLEAHDHPVSAVISG